MVEGDSAATSGQSGNLVGQVELGHTSASIAPGGGAVVQQRSRRQKIVKTSKKVCDVFGPLMATMGSVPD